MVAAYASGRGARSRWWASGGSGKSTLAAALGHRLGRRIPGGREWFRVGRWDHRTLLDMLAIRLRVPLGGYRERTGRLRALRRRWTRAAARSSCSTTTRTIARWPRLLNALDGLPVCWVITARRCLLSGVSVFPVVPPLVTARTQPVPARRGS